MAPPQRQLEKCVPDFSFSYYSLKMPFRLLFQTENLVLEEIGLFYARIKNEIEQNRELSEATVVDATAFIMAFRWKVSILREQN